MPYKLTCSKRQIFGLSHCNLTVKIEISNRVFMSVSFHIHVQQVVCYYLYDKNILADSMYISSVLFRCGFIKLYAKKSQSATEGFRRCAD